MEANFSESKINILVYEGAAFYGKDNVKMYNTPTHSHGDSGPLVTVNNEYFQVRPMKVPRQQRDSLLLRGSCILKSICSLWLFMVICAAGY